jgi:glycosyltransferase involved in cell wall biosynthesis
VTPAALDTLLPPRVRPPAPAERTLRVLHLRASDRLGGPERLVLAHAERAGVGVRVHLASFRRPGAPQPFLDEAERRGLRVEAVAERGSYDPGVVGALRALVRRLRPDVVVGHDYRSDLTLLAAVGRGVPRAALVHGYTGEDRKVRLFEALDRRALRRAAAVVAVSAATRDALEAAGVPPGRLHVAENGVDADAVAAEAADARERLRAAWGVRAGDRVVLSLGRASPEKGQEGLVRAFRALPGPDVRLVLVGDGPSLDGLRALAAGDPRVRFEGWRPDPWACLGAADLLVLPSLREGLPLALLEAMAAGVPVVATRVGGVPHALRGGDLGTLVPPGDALALRAAIATWLRHPEAARARAARAAAHVRERHGLERQARALEAVYRAAAAEARSRGRAPVSGP